MRNWASIYEEILDEYNFTKEIQQAEIVNYVLKILKKINSSFLKIFSGTVCQKFHQVSLC